MASWTLQQIAEITGGTLRQGNPTQKVTRIHTDTRSMEAGDCFFALPALPGYNIDGHKFVGDAATKGAVVAVVSALPENIKNDFGVILVADTYDALRRLSRHHQSQVKAHVIGITGSNGKTSTKEMIAQVLRQGFRTHATKGNFNTQAGVPLTVLAIKPDDEMAVIEMGISHLGEMKNLLQAVQPEVGVITHIGTAHLEFFKTQEGIAQEKGQIIATLPKEGLAVLNADDPITDKLKTRTQAKVVLAGTAPSADFRSENIQMTPRGVRFDLAHKDKSVVVEVPILNRAMVSNALLAAAVGNYFGLTLDQIKKGLETVEIPAGRSQVIDLDGRWLINDAHTANRDSMLAALQTLKEFPAKGHKYAVLGSMGELGEDSEKIHEEIGGVAAKLNLEHLIVLGPLAKALESGAKKAGITAEKLTVCTDQAEALPIVQKYFREKGDCLLVKGSLMRKLEILVHSLGGPPPPHLPS